MIKSIGHRVTAEEIAPDPVKVNSLMALPMPTNVSQLRSLKIGDGRSNQIPEVAAPKIA